MNEIKICNIKKIVESNIIFIPKILKFSKQLKLIVDDNKIIVLKLYSSNKINLINIKEKYKKVKK